MIGTPLSSLTFFFLILFSQLTVPFSLLRVTKELPSYARPVFVRIMSGMDTTSTHKLQKVEARNQGFDINIIQVFFSLLFSPTAEKLKN